MTTRTKFRLVKDVPSALFFIPCFVTSSMDPLVPGLKMITKNHNTSIHKQSTLRTIRPNFPFPWDISCALLLPFSPSCGWLHVFFLFAFHSTQFIKTQITLTVQKSVLHSQQLILISYMILCIKITVLVLHTHPCKTKYSPVCTYLAS